MGPAARPELGRVRSGALDHLAGLVAGRSLSLQARVRGGRDWYRAGMVQCSVVNGHADSTDGCTQPRQQSAIETGVGNVWPPGWAIPSASTQPMVETQLWPWETERRWPMKTIHVAAANKGRRYRRALPRPVLASNRRVAHRLGNHALAAVPATARNERQQPMSDRRSTRQHSELTFRCYCRCDPERRGLAAAPAAGE